MMKYVLITGSSKGLGFGIAKELSYFGYGIILVSSNDKNLIKAKKKLNPKIKHFSIKANAQSENFVKDIIKQTGGLKIEAIIHNFGKKLKNDKHDINIQVLNKSIEINFTKSIEINNALADKLKGNPSKIIYIGSTASLHAKASPCYALSKSLINVYVKNISKHYADKNILICAILPGIMAHRGSDWNKKKISEPKKYLETKNKQPLRRFLTPREIAKNIAPIVQAENLVLAGSIIKMDANDY